MRVISGRIGNAKIHYEAPPAQQVPAEMDSFLKWFNRPPKMDGLIRAAVAHLWFVSIHPFDDGNGRMARAITDLALAQDEATAKRCYSLSSQINSDRKGYYKILESTQKGDLDITEWIIWFLQTFTKAIELALQSIERAHFVGRFWQSHGHFNFNSRQRKVLQKMLESEPEGFEGGITNKKYVSITKTSRESAKRDLADLEAKGILRRNEGQGRSVSYALVL
jgi:Fic family protein